jgi:hypothetical protein
LEPWATNTDFGAERALVSKGTTIKCTAATDHGPDPEDRDYVLVTICDPNYRNLPSHQTKLYENDPPFTVPKDCAIKVVCLGEGERRATVELTGIEPKTGTSI